MDSHPVAYLHVMLDYGLGADTYIVADVIQFPDYH
jgi:hypothetical protein